MRSIRKVLAVMSATLALGVADAETLQVKAEGVRFIPDVIRANVGDVIAFRNMATQSVESVPGMWPEGAPEMKSELGAAYDYQVEREGLYVFKSPPHWGARMGGVIAVGDTTALKETITLYAKITEADKLAKPASGLLRKFRERLASW